MTVDVVTEILIACPLSDVARYASDPTNAPVWHTNVESVEWQTPPPLAVGSRVAFVEESLGRRLAHTYEVVEFVPDARLVMHTTEGSLAMETTYTWERAGEGSTRMKLRNRGEPRGFSKVIAPFTVASLERANTMELALLKYVLEAQRTRAGA